jgi:hypothetical protein
MEKALRMELYETMSSRMFVDECEFDTKMEAFIEIEKIFKQEIEQLT